VNVHRPCYDRAMRLAGLIRPSSRVVLGIAFVAARAKGGALNFAYYGTIEIVSRVISLDLTW